MLEVQYTTIYVKFTNIPLFDGVFQSSEALKHTMFHTVHSAHLKILHDKELN